MVNFILKQISWFKFFGILLLIIIFLQLDFKRLLLVTRNANTLLIVLAVGVNLPMVFLKSSRWQVTMRFQGIRYSLFDAYLVYWSSIFVGLLTPGRLGEFIKVVYVSQNKDISSGQAFSSVLADRLFDLYAISIIGGAASITFFSSGNTATLGFGITVLLLIVPLGIFLNDTTFNRMKNFCYKLGSLGHKLFAPGSWLVEMRLGLHQLTFPWLLVAAGLTTAAYAVFFGQCYLLALALKLPAGFASITFAVAIGSLVTLIPISISGLGTREAAIITYLGMVGVPAETALSFSLLVFFTFYIAGGLIGAVAWWFKPIPLGKLHTIKPNR